MQTLNSLVRQEMTRKEFLAIVSFGAASVVGFSTLVRLLGGGMPLRHGSRKLYGLGPYGGERRSELKT